MQPRHPQSFACGEILFAIIDKHRVFRCKGAGGKAVGIDPFCRFIHANGVGKRHALEAVVKGVAFANGPPGVVSDVGKEVAGSVGGDSS